MGPRNGLASVDLPPLTLHNDANMFEKVIMPINVATKSSLVSALTSVHFCQSNFSRILSILLVKEYK